MEPFSVDLDPDPNQPLTCHACGWRGREKHIRNATRRRR